MVYPKQGGKPRNSSPLREGYECYLYEQELPDGTRDKFSVEKLLGPLDNQGATLIREIAGGARLSVQQQQDMAFYIAMMVARNPLTMRNMEVVSEALFRDDVRNNSDLESILEQLRPEHPDWPEEPLRSLAQRVSRMGSEGAFDIRLPKGYSLRFFGAATTFAETLCKMQWHVLRSEGNGFFVTSDNPVFFGHYGPKEKPGLNYGQLNHPQAIVVFPITRQVALIATKKHPTIIYRKATPHDVNVVNDHCIACAVRWVYSPFQSNKIAKHLIGRLGMTFELSLDSPLTADIVRSRNEDRAQAKQP